MQWFPPNGLGMTKGPVVNVPGRDSLWGPVGKPSPRIWSLPLPWDLITIAAPICSRLFTSGTVLQRKSIPETLETPKGEGTGVPLADLHPAGERVGVSRRGLSQRTLSISWGHQPDS